MLTNLADPDFPMWVLVFERIGPGSAILVFTGALMWKLIPGILKLLTAWRKQSDTITEAVPTVLEGVKDLVQHVERVADHIAGLGFHEDPPPASEGGATFRLRRGSAHHGDPRRGRDVSREEMP